MPRLQIPLVTLQPFTTPFRTTEGEKEFLIIDFLSKYLSAVYTFLVSVVGVIAGIMIVYAGFKWLTAAGSPDKISDAKRKIADASVGLILVLGSYIILRIINPDLVVFQPLRVEQIERIELENLAGGDDPSPLSTNVYDNLSAASIPCPRGGPADLATIVRGFQNRVSYRLGAKGGPPPYSADRRRHPETAETCPPGNACLDCSGFTKLALICAGLGNPGDGTSGQLGSAERVQSIAQNGTVINSRPLQPGDLVGFVAGDQGRSGRPISIGHVLLYLGNGQFAESSRGQGGDNGQAIKIGPLNPRYPITRVKRIGGS